MSCEYIPDAMPGAAPSLDHIRQRRGRPESSAGGESAHSVALTTLSNMNMDGVPIVQKAGNKLSYFDAEGNEISKQKALELAGGVAYYQDPADPCKGRLRLRGQFVGEPRARSIVSGSIGSIGTDIAAPSDLDDFDALPTVEEQEMEDLQDREPPRANRITSQTSAKTGGSFRRITFASSAVALVWLLVLSTGPSQQLMIHGGSKITTYHSTKYYADRGLSLSSEIVQLLEADEKESQPQESRISNDDGSTVSSLDERRSLAVAEVDRILASRQVSEILGSGPKRQQQQEFQRIVHLLHPDKGLVSTSDDRASLALRLTFAARRRMSRCTN